MRQWVLAHPLLAFPLVYLGWAYLFWSPLLLSESSVWAFPTILYFLIGGASPWIAGLDLAALLIALWQRGKIPGIEIKPNP